MSERQIPAGRSTCTQRTVSFLSLPPISERPDNRRSMPGQPSGAYHLDDTIWVQSRLGARAERRQDD